MDSPFYVRDMRVFLLVTNSNRPALYRDGKVLSHLSPFIQYFLGRWNELSQMHVSVFSISFKKRNQIKNFLNDTNNNKRTTNRKTTPYR